MATGDGLRKKKSERPKGVMKKSKTCVALTLNQVVISTKGSRRSGKRGKGNASFKKAFEREKLKLGIARSGYSIMRL